MTTFAVIPAGGKSSRMGRPKLALPLGDRTVLEHVIAAARRAGIDHILVIVGPHVPELVALAEKAGAKTLLLEHETPDMRATVEAGLQQLEAHFKPQQDDAWLLVPADHPTIESSVIRRLLQDRMAHADRSIFIPTYRGKRGHPALIGWQHVPAIRQLTAGQGLNEYFRQRSAETREVPVESAEVLADLDTPADYARLQQRV